MEKKKRTTVYFNERLRWKADVLMAVLDFGENFTGFTEQLVREKWAAVHAEWTARGEAHRLDAMLKELEAREQKALALNDAVAGKPVSSHAKHGDGDTRYKIRPKGKGRKRGSQMGPTS